MEVSFSDANLTTRVEAVRYICLVAILIALPAAADARQRDGARRGRSVQNQTAPTPQDRPAAEQRPASEQRSRPEQRQARERGSEPRQSAQQQQRPTTGLGPIGLPPAPAMTTNTPWWERQGAPAWERKQVPWWERPQIDPYKTMNPARVMLDQERDARRLAKTPRPGHPIYRPGHIAPPIYVLPPYGYYVPGYSYNSGFGVAATTSEAPPPPPPMPETGFLKLDVEPRQSVQVFVDGLYIGMLADIGDEIELRLGAHRIELRAPGYRPLILDTQIVFDRMVVYRGELERMEQAADAPAPQAPKAPEAPKAPQAPQAPAGSRTMYLIPGCYMGNVQPTASMLRADCDISKLITALPQ